MTNISWKMSVNDQHLLKFVCWLTNSFAANVGQWGSFLQKWTKTVICTVSHLYWAVFLGKCGCFIDFAFSPVVAVPCSAIRRRLISLTPLTNISWKMSVNDQHFLKNVCQWPTFIEICLSMTNIFAADVGQWGSFLQKWRTTIICTVSHLYECFFWKVWLFHWFCVLTGLAVPCSAISRRLISLTPLTNISWKMSVNDPYFLQNICQRPTFIENCLSMIKILAANVG